MIPPTNTGITRTTTMVPQRSIPMGVKEKNMPFIVQFLTDLYSDQCAAVIREYSTNALDSHRDAGITRPIEVTLPGPLSPFFKVKDYGVGMGVDEVIDVYSSYGESTKRESNDTVGYLGLGSKSALTYTNQFSVIAVKDGIKTIVNVSRLADGTSNMDIIDTVTTTEPNGVEIVVPSKNAQEFERKAHKFFRFWEKGTVLVNGKEPEFGSNIVVADKFYLTNPDKTVTRIGGKVMLVDGLEEDYVVMGNVAYVVKEHGLFGGYRHYSKPFGVVAYVNIGAVDFTPSREALHYTDATNVTLRAARTAFTEGLTAAAVKDVNDAPTHSEAVSRARKWKDRFSNGLGALTYRGVTIPSVFNVDNLHWQPYRSRGSVYNETQVNLERVLDENSVVVVGWKGDSLSSRNKEKAREWQRQNNVNFKHFFFVEKEFGQPWTDDVNVIDWSSIAAIRLGGPAQPRVKREQPYDVVNEGGYLRQTDTIDTSKPVLFFSPSEKFDLDDLTRFLPDATLVSIGLNRWDKFQRDFPTAKHVKEAIQARYEQVAAAVTADDVAWKNLDYSEKNAFQGLDPVRIDDPEVKAFILNIKNPDAARRIEKWNEWTNFARVTQVPIIPLPDAPRVKSDLRNRYPLLTIGYGEAKSHKDHLYLYMNAVYNSKKEN